MTSKSCSSYTFGQPPCFLRIFETLRESQVDVLVLRRIGFSFISVKAFATVPIPYSRDPSVLLFPSRAVYHGPSAHISLSSWLSLKERNADILALWPKELPCSWSPSIATRPSFLECPMT
jgi:hypothetical protein